MTGEVTMPQKIMVTPRATRNGAYEGSADACGSDASGNGRLEEFERNIITPALRDLEELRTSPRIWPGWHPGKPCTLAPTSTDHQLPDPRGASIPTADEPGASAQASRRRWHTGGRLRLVRR